MRTQKNKPKSDFPALCEQAQDVMTNLIWHPDCPESVREELTAAFGEIANRARDTNEERSRFDLRLAFAALANGQFAK